VIEPLGGIHQNRATKLHNTNVIPFQNFAGGEKEINVNRRTGYKGKSDTTRLRFLRN